MLTFGTILLLYYVAILYGKRKERLKTGDVIVLMLLAALQAGIMLTQMYMMSVPSQ